MKHDDGGPAYPYSPADSGCATCGCQQPGMSLWDYYAGQAMTAAISFKPCTLWQRFKSLLGFNYCAATVDPLSNAVQAANHATAMIAEKRKREA